MIHLDLFSGIGGFSYAADQVWENVEHIFVEYDPFCQAVLKKHWPDAEVNADIRQFVADAKSRKQHQLPVQRKQDKGLDVPARPYLLTGGFPCQPFSQAGRRKGTGDDRYLWPSMLECIALYHPRWVIAENVAGLVTWNDGVVLETVCTDLEKEGYEVQPFIISAAAVGAPHRRDRVWIIAHSQHEQAGNAKRRRNDKRTPVGAAGSDTNASHTSLEYMEGRNGKPKRRKRYGSIDTNSSNSRLEGGGRKGRDTVDSLVESGATKGEIGVKTGLRLQPAFVEWMMGYPEGWTEIPDSKLLEMRLSRRSQRK